MKNKSRFIKPPAMILRYIMLGFFLVYVTYLGFMHQQYQAQFPPVDAICPFGGLESLYSLIFHGQYLNRIFISSFILLGITVLLVIFSGRSFCSWICPLGTLQGIMGGLGNKIFKRKQSLSQKKDHKIRWLRYIILIIFTAGAWYGGKLLIRPYDPWVAWMHLSVIDNAITEFPIAFSILFGSLILSLFIPRLFCRYLCPMGIFLGIINRVSPFKLVKNDRSCINCKLCDKKCPVGIDISNQLIIDKTECLSCGECVPVCPVPKTLEFKMGKRKIISPLSMGIIVIIIFFGVIGLTKTIGLYKSSYGSIEALKESGNLKPEEIKGFMTLYDVANLFDLNRDTLYQHLALDAEIIPGNTKIKDIKNITSTAFEADSVRKVVARLLDVPLSPESAGCTNISADTNVLSADNIAGTMTLREVAKQYEITLTALYEELGLDSLKVSPETPCRDLKDIVSPDFHTSKVREAVTRLIRK